MTTPVTTGAIAKLLWPGINAIFQNYEQHPAEWSRIFAVTPSTKAYEEDVGMSEFGYAAVKPEGQSVEYDDFEQGFTPRYVNVVYAKGFRITREVIEDNQYTEVAARRTRALRRAMLTTKEVVHANVLNRAFNSSYTMTNGDGKELLATDHPSGPYGGTFANELTTSAQLSEASLEDLDILIHNAKDARGLNIALMGRLLVVPPALKHVANRILNSERQNDTGNNAINSLRAGSDIRDGFMVNHYLTSTTQYYVITNCEDGLKSMERRGLEFTEDNDFNTEDLCYKATERYVPGWSDPRGVYGSGV